MASGFRLAVSVRMRTFRLISVSISPKFTGRSLATVDTPPLTEAVGSVILGLGFGTLGVGFTDELLGLGGASKDGLLGIITFGCSSEGAFGALDLGFLTILAPGGNFLSIFFTGTFSSGFIE